ncbi:MAG: UvrD-helicase domain-containing protein [Betaproteobacteria bacterium]
MSDIHQRARDQDVRDRAVDIARSAIVRAPAGSGKTTLLIQRYLALLARVEEPEEVIAITFTRKAAAEMRERVLEAFAAAEDEASDLDSATRRLARTALARDRQRDWQLAANASRLRIQTIDSLNASITRQMPLGARFGAQPDIIDDATALYRDAARAVLGEVNADGPFAADVAALLAHLDNNLLVAEGLLADMLRARDHWLRNLPRMNIREALEAALARVRANTIDAAAGHFPAEHREETLALARFADQNKSEGRASAAVSPIASAACWPDSTEASLPCWLDIAELLLTQKGTWRKRGGLNKNVGFPQGESREQKAHFAAAKTRMGDLLERLENSDRGARLAQLLDKLRRLPPARYTEQQWDVLGAIVRLLPRATAMLWTVFSAQGRCDFTEIALAATRALGADDEPTDLALALDYRIQHLLVDEFQDTSVAQFELLGMLTRGWSEGDGRTLFLVGDPMQSIYRFRKAEVEQFRRATEDGIGIVALNELQLTVNFRSRRGVVEWVNETFAALMPGGHDNASGQVPYAASVAFKPADDSGRPAVTWHPQLVRRNVVDANQDDDEPDNDADEARAIVGIIVAMRHEMKAARLPGERPESIALLVRNRTHLAAIVPALKAANIPFRAVDIDPLKERPVVRDLQALTRALLHPSDRIAWLAVLRAPWCGLTLNDLAVLVGGAMAVDGTLAPDTRGLWEIIGDDSRLALISADGRFRLERLRAVLAPALAASRRQPLRDLVESVWLSLHGPACLASAGDLDDAAQLLDLLEAEAQAQSGGSHIGDLDPLDARVDTLYAGNRVPDDGDHAAVQIMTIHKAKGLEFDAVILPALHRVPRRDEKGLVAWAELPIHGSGRHELVVAPIRETGADDEGEDEAEKIYQYVRQHELEKQRQEEVRLLYVAATRAKRRLHLLGCVAVKSDKGGEKLTAPRAGSLLAALWPAVEAVFDNAMLAPRRELTPSRPGPVNCDAAARAMRLATPHSLPRMPAAIAPGSGRASAKQDSPIDFEWAGETARHIGTVVHAFLQRIAIDGLANWNAGRVARSQGVFEVELQQLGVEAGELPGASRRVGEALARTLDDSRGRWVLDAQRLAKSEWRISGTRDREIVNVAIDRSFIDAEGIRWIIDFKTGGHEGGDVAAFMDNEQKRYRAQLETYAALVDALSTGTPRPSIKLGLYFPLLAGWREWDWRSG